jgi:hypothetical protein
VVIISRLIRPDWRPKIWRFHLRALLLTVLVAALGLGWLARHLRREKEQVALVAELNQEGIFAWQYEPNSVGWVLYYTLPSSVNEWLVHRCLGWTFCNSPSRISAFPIRSAEVPQLIERMRRRPYL